MRMRSVISITTAELLRLYLLQERFKIMDVRFAYEYNQNCPKQ